MAWSYDSESITSFDVRTTKNEMIVSTTDKSPDQIYLRVWYFEPKKIFSAWNNDFGFYLIREIKEGHSKTINCIKYSTTGKLLCTVSDDCKVILWQEKDCFLEFGSNEKIFSWTPK